MKNPLKPSVPPLGWELDARSTRFLFEAARDKAAEAIERVRDELIRLEHFDPLPQIARDGQPAMFDHKSKTDIIAEKRQWLAYYENIHLFCLKVDERVLQVEAERFADQMADFFAARRKEGR